MYHYQTNVEYYLRELEWLRVEGANFAKRYPNIAAALDIGATESVNPQVERLIESVAFLTGRVNRNIEEDFTEIPLSILTILNPYLAEPIPAMAVLSFRPEGTITKINTIEKGSRIETEFWEGTSCYFTTCWDVDLWPFTIETVRLPPRGAQRVADLIRIRVSAPAGYLRSSDLSRLSFFFGNDTVRASALYDHMSKHLIGIVLSDEETRQNVPLTRQNFRFHGLTREENSLPDYLTGMQSHRLLLEYFKFPEKFHFMTISGLENRPPTDTLDILLFFDEPIPIQGEGWKDMFQINCVPMINLYQTQATPFFLDGRQYEHRLVADTARQRTTEVHSIHKVELHFPGISEPITIQPYFGFQHDPGVDDGVYWWMRRTPCVHVDALGVETLLSFVGLDFSKIGIRRQFVTTHITCSNRDVAQRLEVGTEMKLTENIPDGAPLS